jgi:hypothetical protein
MTDAELEAEHKALLREAADLTAEDARLKQLHDPVGLIRSGGQVDYVVSSVLGSSL